MLFSGTSTVQGFEIITKNMFIAGFYLDSSVKLGLFLCSSMKLMIASSKYFFHLYEILN